MARYSDTLRDQNLAPVAGAKVYVKLRDGTTPVITSDSGEVIKQPIITNEYGAYSFNGPVNYYDINYYIGSRLVQEARSVPVGGPVTSFDVTVEMVELRDESRDSTELAREYANADLDQPIPGAASPADRGAAYWSSVASEKSNEAAGYSASADEAKDQAATFATLAATNANDWYGDTSAGIAGTSVGDYFYVPDLTNKVLRSYKHDTGGVAVEQFPIPSATLLQQYAPAYAAASNVGNAFTMATPFGITSYTNNQEFQFRIPLDFAGFAQDVVPTLKVDTAAALGIYDDTDNFVDASTWTGGAYKTVRYSTSFGGLFREIAPKPKNPDTLPIAELYDSGVTSDGETYTLTSPGADFDALKTGSNRILWARFNVTNTVTQPEVLVNGEGPYPLLDQNGGSLALGSIVPAVATWFRYVDAGGDPYYQLLMIPPSSGGGDDLRAQQLATQQMYGIQRIWNELNRTAFDAIPRTLEVDYDFATAGQETQFKAAKGAWPATYTSYSHNVGGWIEMDLSTGGGLGYDPNHVAPGPGFLQLPLVMRPADGFPVDAGTDFTNAILELDIQLLDLSVPPGVILGMHFQASDSAAPIGTGTSKRLNYLYTGELLNDVIGLGFGKPAGPAWQGAETSIADTGVVTLTVDFIPNDAFWMQLGSSYARADTYSVAPIARALENGLLSMILIALHPQQNPPTQEPLAGLTGTLRLHGLRLRIPS